MYNEERPHEALGQVPPESIYLASARRYPRPLIEFSAAPWDRLTRVDKEGFITWDRRRLFVSTALALDHVELRYGETVAKHARWDVVFGPLSVGLIEETSRGPIFKPSKGRMNDRREVSVMPDR